MTTPLTASSNLSPTSHPATRPRQPVYPSSTSAGEPPDAPVTRNPRNVTSAVPSVPRPELGLSEDDLTRVRAYLTVDQGRYCMGHAASKLEGNWKSKTLKTAIDSGGYKGEDKSKVPIRQWSEEEREKARDMRRSGRRTGEIASTVMRTKTDVDAKFPITTLTLPPPRKSNEKGKKRLGSPRGGSGGDASRGRRRVT